MDNSSAGSRVSKVSSRTIVHGTPLALAPGICSLPAAGENAAAWQHRLFNPTAASTAARRTRLLQEAVIVAAHTIPKATPKSRAMLPSAPAS